MLKKASVFNTSAPNGNISELAVCPSSAAY
jgi:hypothetical protein